MIGCALIPRLDLLAALEGRRELMSEPTAVAPPPGSPQVLGEVSGAAEAFGLRRGMPLGEALDRCPRLRLVAADPERAERGWERLLEALEGIGAGVEPGGPGEAFFALRSIAPMWGGLEAALGRARWAAGASSRVGAGPNRLCARAMARRARRRSSARRSMIGGAEAKRFIASLPVGELDATPGRTFVEAGLAMELERLGITTLGDLARLPDDAVADRFAEAGMAALAVARGEPDELEPRQATAPIEVGMDLEEAASGAQLGRILAVLLDRLLAHPLRAHRAIRRLRLTARLVGGGSWRCEAWPRSATGSAQRLGLALQPRLAEIPSPASRLVLRATELAPGDGEQLPLAPSPTERRRERLGEAIEQVRSSCGRESLLHVVEVDPGSRLPERRVALAPLNPPGADGSDER